MIQSIPVLQTQEASEGVSASQETPRCIKDQLLGCGGRPSTAPSSRVKSITAPTTPNRNQAAGGEHQCGAGPRGGTRTPFREAMRAGRIPLTQRKKTREPMSSLDEPQSSHPASCRITQHILVKAVRKGDGPETFT